MRPYRLKIDTVTGVRPVPLSILIVCDVKYHVPHMHGHGAQNGRPLRFLHGASEDIAVRDRQPKPLLRAVAWLRSLAKLP